MWIYYIVQKIIKKGMPKVILQKCLFTFSMWKQPRWSYFDIMNGIQSPLYGHIHNQGTQKDDLIKKNYKTIFGFLLHLLFHDYSGLAYDYN
jgi:hypothetical protein